LRIKLSAMNMHPDARTIKKNRAVGTGK